MCVLRDGKQPRPNSDSSATLPITQTKLIYQDQTLEYTSDADSDTQITLIVNTTSTPTPSTQYHPRPLNNNLLLKYIHQYLYICPDILPGDIPDVTQFRSDRNFIPEEFHNLFGCRRFRNYSSVIASAKNCRLTISVIPPPMIGEFYTTQKKCKTLS